MDTDLEGEGNGHADDEEEEGHDEVREVAAVPRRVPDDRPLAAGAVHQYHKLHINEHGARKRALARHAQTPNTVHTSPCESNGGFARSTCPKRQILLSRQVTDNSAIPELWNAQAFRPPRFAIRILKL